MSDPTLNIHHTTRHIRSAPHAFAFGFSEALGKAIAWALVIGLAIFAMEQMGAFDGGDASTETTQE